VAPIVILEGLQSTCGSYTAGGENAMMGMMGRIIEQRRDYEMPTVSAGINWRDLYPSSTFTGIRRKARVYPGIPTFLLCLSVALIKTVNAASPITQTICVGSPIPPGWVIINMMFTPGQCGNSGPPVQGATTNEVIQNISQMPVGTSVEICAAVPYPVGWVIASGPSQDVSKCHGWGIAPHYTVEWIKRIQ
jgi:hypothetical protein